MPRGSAITFSDLIGKLDTLRVICTKCGRAGHYPLRRLLRARGGGGKVIDWLDEVTADCPKKRAGNMSDQRAARCPHLAKVL